MKQETLKKVAEGYSERHQDVSGNLGKYLVSAVFQDGAKWQAERSYSDGDMMFAYEQGARLALISQSPLALHKGEFPTPKEWFEEFKNK